MQSQQKFIMIPAGANFVYQQQKQIAPAPVNHKVTSILGMNGFNMMPSSAGPMTKKNLNHKTMPYGEQTPSVARRNARERNRVKQVNDGYTNLRQHIPSSIISALSSGGRGDSKKLSKVDTLRMAVEYIQGLQELIEECDSQGSSIGSASPASSYYASENSQDQFALQNSFNSEQSASPTPSYNSDISIGNTNEYLQSVKSEDYIQYKFEPFDSYVDTPDEDILDYITSWQEQ